MSFLWLHTIRYSRTTRCPARSIDLTSDPILLCFAQVRTNSRKVHGCFDIPVAAVESPFHSTVWVWESFGLFLLYFYFSTYMFYQWFTFPKKINHSVNWSPLATGRSVSHSQENKLFNKSGPYLIRVYDTKNPDDGYHGPFQYAKATKLTSFV